jgi:hypothetical protein
MLVTLLTTRLVTCPKKVLALSKEEGDDEDLKLADTSHKTTIT